MEENKTAIETTPTIAPVTEVKVLTSDEIDLEARNAALEEEKARLSIEKENYRVAYLKEKSKKENLGYDDEDSDDKMRRIAQ